jgi:hypothetical protein
MKSNRHLGLSLEFQRFAQVCISSTGFPGRDNSINQINHGRSATLQQIMIPGLNDVDPSQQFTLGEVVAGLASTVDIQQRAANPVIRHLARTLTLVGHMAIGTGNATAG